MSKNKLFEDAIADAKTLRNVAMANAKRSLEEAFGPQMQSMLNNKLAEMEDLEETEEVDENSEVEEGQNNDNASNVGMDFSKSPAKNNESTETNEASEMEEELEGILRELGMSDQNESSDLDESEDVEEGYESHNSMEVDNVDEKDEDPSADMDDSGMDSPEMGSEDGMDDMGGEEGGEDQMLEPVTSITVGDLVGFVKQAVQDAMSGGEDQGMGDEMGGADDMSGDEPDMSGGEEPKGDQDLDLDELLAELDGDVNEQEVEEGQEIDENQEVDESQEVDENQDLDESEEMDEAAKKAFFEKGRTKGKHSGVPKQQGKVGFQKAPTGKTPKVNEVVAKSPGGKGTGWYKVKPKGGHVGKPTQQGKVGFVKAPTGKTPKVTESVARLNEAIKTINALKGTIKETNLLNAKLLYVNKLFKAKPLNESQKVKVVAAFDKARTTTEAKLIYNSLSETLTAKKTQLKESFMKGFASKSVAGVKPKQVIVEDASVRRMQELAGIIKSN